MRLQWFFLNKNSSILLNSGMGLVMSEWAIHVTNLFGDKLVISTFITTLIILISIFYYVKNRNLPPGPFGLPFLGYCPLLKDQTCHLTLSKLQKQYGDIFSFNYAGALYINMGSVKVIKEIHIAKAECFEKTSDFSLLSHFFADGVGIINGESWKVLKKFTLQQFKELGMTSMKENLSGPMYDSVKETVEYLKLKKGKSVDLVQLLIDKCNAILRHTMFGGYGITEQEVNDINKSFDEVFAIMTVTNLLLSGNFARYIILPFKSGYEKAKKHHRMIENILTKIVNDHKSSFNEEHPRDFIDAYFKERNEKLSKGDSAAVYFTDRALVATLLQFVGDGVLSIAIFASLFLKYVVNHEAEQDKIYSELMEVVGHERAPTIEDKNKMPYTNALILEIMRTSAFFFTVFPSQQCIRETTICGYRIPKGALTLMNVYTSHYNPQIYADPEKFNPSRFISSDGKQRSELPVTFGIGRRGCIGEVFTMAQVFLFLTTIIQNFKLTVPKSSDSKIYEAIESEKLEVCVWPRNQMEN